MIIRDPKSAGPGSTEKDEKAAESLARAGAGDECRCKETSIMSPGELFKLMVSDLAFWKKKKKDNTFHTDKGG